MKIVNKFYSVDGTVKYLMETEDDLKIETIFYPFSKIANLIAKIIFFGSYLKIPFKIYNFSCLKFLYQHTDYYGICVSSQIGCDLGCKFCATGQLGLVRNLQAQEIIDQIVTVIKNYQPKNLKKLEIVFAGMGEPLFNYKNVTEAIGWFKTNLNIFGVEQVYFSIMTVGVPPLLLNLAKSGLGVNLFLSLHATQNQQRENIMPVSKKFGIREILTAASNYQKISHTRPVRLNYTLIRGINDTFQDAQRLTQLATQENFLSQIKMFNFFNNCKYKPVSLLKLFRFLRILKKAGLNYVFDISRGISNQAGCGQLRYYKNS